MNFFGTRRAPAPAPKPVTSQDSAAQIAKLDKEIARLEKQRAVSDKEIAKLAERAKAVARTDRTRALMYLKERKRKMRTAQQHAGYIDRLGMARDAIVASATQSRVVSALGDGSQHLQRIAQQTDIDKVDDTIADFEDATQRTDEVGELLAGDVLSMEDDPELAAELDGMLEGDLLDVPSVPASAAPAAAAPAAAAPAAAAPLDMAAMPAAPSPAAAAPAAVAADGDFGELEAMMG